MEWSSVGNTSKRIDGVGSCSEDRFFYERRCHNEGCSVVAGVDEAGRGPLAGPVVIAAVVLPSDWDFSIPVNDSKALTDRFRRRCYEQLVHDSRILWSVSVKSASEIDRLNILRATHEGMREVVQTLGVPVDMALVDGLRVPLFPVPAQFIVKGDGLSASIGAASIIAKVTRDDIMESLDAEYPGYGFARHKGYGTAAHLAALARLGACPEHRRSFSPVARVLGLLPAFPEQLSLGL